jgi:hypothetical protein
MKPPGEPVLGPDERPNRLVASDDPEAIGLGLEASDFLSPPMDDPRVQRAIKETEREIRAAHEHNEKGGKS